MFLSSQSKSYFTQEHVKSKIMHDEVQMLKELLSNIEDINKTIFKNIVNIDEEGVEQLKRKTTHLVQKLEEAKVKMREEVQQRNHRKSMEQAFFKSTLKDYEDKIQKLKHYLLVLEQNVQKLQKKGYLPYMQNPSHNKVLHILQKQGITNTLKKKQHINNILKSLCRVQLPNEKQSTVQLFMGWQQLRNQVIQQKKIQLNEKIRKLQQQNKILKSGIKEQKHLTHQQIMQHHRNKHMSENEYLEFWDGLNEELHRKLTHTEDTQPVMRKCPRSKSTHQIFTEVEEKPPCLKEIGNQLTNSFINHCSYLISDRFIQEEQSDI